MVYLIRLVVGLFGVFWFGDVVCDFELVLVGLFNVVLSEILFSVFEYEIWVVIDGFVVFFLLILDFVI